jgi:hypothetical protein
MLAAHLPPSASRPGVEKGFGFRRNFLGNVPVLS